MVHRATAITIVVGTAFSRAIPDCHASRSHCRCSRPTNRTGVTVGRPSTPQFEARDKPALPQHGTARDLPIRGVTAATVGQEVTAEAPLHRQAHMHRDAPAVKARERPRQPLRELEKICIQRVHGPPLADFAKGAERVHLLFCPERVSIHSNGQRTSGARRRLVA